jgi:hypothetical protein
MTWENEAACRPELRPAHMDAVQWTNIFFPKQGGPTRPALEVCRRCPVTVECAEWANATPFERDGIWGGMTGRQRRATRKTNKVGIVYPAELRARGLAMFDAGVGLAEIAQRLGVPERRVRGRFGGRVALVRPLPPGPPVGSGRPTGTRPASRSPRRREALGGSGQTLASPFRGSLPHIR